MIEEKFICQYCGRSSKNKAGLSLHKNLCKNNPNRIVKIRSKYYSTTVCNKCGREITNCNFERHYNSCNCETKENIYHLDHDDLICKFCGKECKNKNSLVQHECRCKENPDAYDMSYAVVANGFNSYHEKIKSGEITIWNKGLTKETSESIRKQIDTYHQHLKEGKVRLLCGNDNPAKNSDTKYKISNSMQLAVKEGRHKTSYNSGSGYKSYIQIFDQIYFLRSSYELIYSYYLAINKIKFEVESIRVQAVENPYRKIFISDFYIPAENKIVETKGWETEKDLYEKQSFEKEGYNFQLINGKEIDIIKKKLINYIDIENILDQLKSNQDNMYYTFDLTQYYK